MNKVRSQEESKSEPNKCYRCPNLALNEMLLVNSGHFALVAVCDNCWNELRLKRKAGYSNNLNSELPNKISEYPKGYQGQLY